MLDASNHLFTRYPIILSQAAESCCRHPFVSWQETPAHQASAHTRQAD